MLTSHSIAHLAAQAAAAAAAAAACSGGDMVLAAREAATAAAMWVWPAAAAAATAWTCGEHSTSFRSSSMSRFSFARRFWNHVITWEEREGSG